MLREHMPELVPTWERLVELAGGGDRGGAHALDVAAAAVPGRLLAGACWWRRRADPRAQLRLRARAGFEGVVWSHRLGRPPRDRHERLPVGPAGRRERGRAGGLADVRRPAGGRRRLRHPAGHALPAARRARRSTRRQRASRRGFRINLAHNADAGRRVGRDPARPSSRPTASRAVPPRSAVATNHQGAVEWTEHAAATRHARARAPPAGAARRPRPRTREAFAGAFLEPPLYSHGRLRTRLRHALHGGLPAARGRAPSTAGPARPGASRSTRSTRRRACSRSARRSPRRRAR